MKPLTIDEIQRLRATQATWQRIADDETIRLVARCNAQEQADRIEAQIRATRAVAIGPVCGARELGTLVAAGGRRG